MSTKVRLFKFLIDMNRITIEEVEEPYKTKILENNEFLLGT